MSPPVSDPSVVTEVFVLPERHDRDTAPAEELGRSISVPDFTATKVEEESVIVVTQRRRDWLKYFVAIFVLFLTTSGGVADQQLSKIITSDTFRAPFFYLWCSGVTRTFVYLFYLPLRLLYEHVEDQRRARRDVSYRRRPIRKVTGDLIHEANLAFGKDGITTRTFLLNILPFSLSWILTNGLFYWSVNFSSVSESVTIGSSFIVTTYLISWIFLKEKLLAVKAVGIVICLSGVGLTAYASGVEFGQSSDSVYGALLTTGSATSLALTTVAFKKIYGTPNVNQIAMYLSVTSATNALISWPIFLMLRLTGGEVWTFPTSPWDLIFAATSVSALSSVMYYLGISLVSPVFIALTRPLQIVMNYTIDLARQAIVFNALSAIGTGLVLVGFLIMIIPNNIVSLEIKAYTIRLWPARKFTLNHSHSDSELPTQMRTNSTLPTDSSRPGKY